MNSTRALLRRAHRNAQEPGNHHAGYSGTHPMGDRAMTDPRDFDRRMDRQMDMDARTGAPTPWGWIASAVFIIIVLALVFSSGHNTQTASNQTNPPATTGMAPRTAPLAIPPATGTPPIQAPSTTGQGR
jgi:hypothetical protein